MNRVFSLFVLLVLVASTQCFAQTLSPYTLWGNPTGSTAFATTLPSHTIIPCMTSATCSSGINPIDPTGTNDSYPAIQAAINAAYAHNSGGTAPITVYIPPGTYKLSHPLALNYAGLTLEGDTSWGTWLAPASARAIDLLTAGPNRGAASVLVRNLGILATNAIEPEYGVIYIAYAYDSGLENVSVTGVPNAVANGIYIANSGNINLKNVNVYAATTSGASTGILVTTNSQVSLDNVDVEQFNGTSGKGIATSGALVFLDIISSHVEDNGHCDLLQF